MSSMTSQHELVVPTIVSVNTAVGGCGDNDGADEVTETMIIGVTKTGVIRKRSFKRKLTEEEKSKRAYGSDKAEYAKIAEHVMAERIFSGTIEGLRERLKMLEYMRTDCMDMVVQWRKRREDMLQARRRKDVDIVIALIISAVLCFGFCWLIKAFIW